MALFSKRPLALFCMLFLLASLASGYVSPIWTVVGMVLFVFVSLLLFSIPKTRRKLFGLGLCFAVIFLSLCHSFLTTELPSRRAERMVGERTVLCEVIEDGKHSRNFSDAVVRVINVDGEQVRVKAWLVCDFPAELSVGDRIYAYARIESYESYSSSVIASRKENDGILLTICVENEEHGQIRRLSEQPFHHSMLTSENGLRILIHRIRTGLRSYLNECLGEEMGALSNGFFVGDTSEISSETMLSFRRAGVMHLLSVSGLHLTVLLGAIELLLRVLSVPKKARILAVSFFSMLLLILTGFAASACRAVLMLLSVYYQFMLAEDCDGITSLFTSVALIVLISPYSVNDLGLWMSFLATLGLLTVYPVWETALYRIKSGKGWKGWLVCCARGILGGLLLTSAANLFLLPITWWYFGEFSWMGIFCNVAISFVSSLFLVSIPLFLMLGWIPFAGGLFRWISLILGTAVKGIAEAFSRIPNGVVSLRYEFCAWIVPVVSAVMAMFLLIRLRRKWLLAVPPCAAVAAFLLCFSGQLLFFSKTEAVYLQTDAYTETICWKEDHRLAVCDFSSGGWRGTGAVLAAYGDSYATEVDTLILSHVHKGHLSMLEHLSERLVLRRIMLPMPLDRSEAELTLRCSALAKERQIFVEFYDSAEPIPLWDGLVCYAERQKGEKHDGIAVTAMGTEQSMLYLSPNALSETDSETVANRMEKHETVIFGGHGNQQWTERHCLLGERAKTEHIVYASRKCASFYHVEGFDGTAWIPRVEEKSGRFCWELS